MVYLNTKPFSRQPRKVWLILGIWWKRYKRVWKSWNFQESLSTFPSKTINENWMKYFWGRYRWEYVWLNQITFNTIVAVFGEKKKGIVRNTSDFEFESHAYVNWGACRTESPHNVSANRCACERKTVSRRWRRDLENPPATMKIGIFPNRSSTCAPMDCIPASDSGWVKLVTFSMVYLYSRSRHATKPPQTPYMKALPPPNSCTQLRCHISRLLSHGRYFSGFLGFGWHSGDVEILHNVAMIWFCNLPTSNHWQNTLWVQISTLTRQFPLGSFSPLSMGEQSGIFSNSPSQSLICSTHIISTLLPMFNIPCGMLSFCTSTRNLAITTQP